MVDANTQNNGACRAEIRVPGMFHMFKGCARGGKVEVPTDRGTFILCTQHFKVFLRNGVWVKAGTDTYIQPKHVLLAHRDDVLGVTP